jgi:putative SOS response-associated peptidase YedK
MCGRFVLVADPNTIQTTFNLNSVPDLPPRYNIAPTQILPVITNENPRELSFHKWGLIPSWAKDESMASKMINARSEGIDEKPAFRSALKRRRCIVPASGFYEWQKQKDGKQPMLIHLKDQPLFGFAGLWEIWNNPQGDELRTFTIITTEANEFMKSIHDRMPVILPSSAYDLWLRQGEVAASELKPLLKPYDAGELDAYPVSKLVNKTTVDVPECVQRIA